MGPHAVRRGPGRLRPVRLRHGRVRVRDRGVRGRRRRAAHHAGGVHAGRRRRERLLRREPGGRVQPADGRGAAGRRRRGHLRRHGVPGGPERAVPRRPQGGGLRRRRHRLQERVRGVRAAPGLLQRRLRHPRHVPAVRQLAVLQERVPARLQLRLRRRHLHLYLHLRHRQLPHHVLPKHLQPQVVREQQQRRQHEPGRPASCQRHGLLRRPGRQVLVVVPVRLRVGAVQVGSVPPRARGSRVHVALRRLAPPAAVVERARPRAIGHRPYAAPRAPPTPSAHQAQAHGTPRAAARGAHPGPARTL